MRYSREVRASCRAAHRGRCRRNRLSCRLWSKLRGSNREFALPEYPAEAVRALQSPGSLTRHTSPRFIVMNNLRERINALSPEQRLLLEARLKSKKPLAAQPETIPRRKHSTHLPLSLDQERLWFLDQL